MRQLRARSGRRRVSSKAAGQALLVYANILYFDVPLFTMIKCCMGTAAVLQRPAGKRVPARLAAPS